MKEAEEKARREEEERQKEKEQIVAAAEDTNEALTEKRTAGNCGGSSRGWNGNTRK